MSNIELLSPKQVISRLSIPSTTLYRWISEGKFPKPIKIGDRRTAFKLTDLEKWLETKAEQENFLNQEGHSK